MLIMRNDLYILNDRGEPEPATDLMTWSEAFANSNRIVAREIIGDAIVSTVFLGLDHSWGKGPPILWETMVFGGKLDHEQDRCPGSREQAEAMHQRMVARVKQANT